MFTPNPSVGSQTLLQMMIRFLNVKDVSFEKIQILINESTTVQLIPSFAFLCSWILANSDYASHNQLTSFQSVFHLIDLFSAKVTPVLLLKGFINQKMSFSKPNMKTLELFKPIFIRMQRLKMILYPFSLEVTSVKYSLNLTLTKELSLENLKNNHHFFSLDFETDPCFHETHVENFQRSILEHASIENFAPLLELQNSKFILTQAIIKLLKLFNNDRNATHPQLLFMFSTLFIYIKAFAEKDEIDGQIICEYLQSSPYLSPFCLLAFVNHIPPELYLFNLLIPSKLAGKNLETSQSGLGEVIKHFTLIDLSMDQILNNLFPIVPNIALSYFLSDRSLFRAPARPKTDTEIMEYLYFCGSSTTERVKEAIKLAQDGQLNALHVAAMDFQLLKSLTFTILQNMKEMILQGALNRNLYDFLIIVIATIMPTYGNQLGEKFFSLPISDYFTAEIIIRALAFDSSKLLVFRPVHFHVIPYVFECLKQNGPIQFYARFFLLRYFCSLCTGFNEKIEKCIIECDDIMILLATISFIDFMTHHHNYKSYLSSIELRNSVIKKLPFNYSVSNLNNKPFIYDSIKSSPSAAADFNATSQLAIQQALQMDFRSNPMLSLGILIYSSKLKSKEVAQLLSKITCEQLHNKADPSIIKCPFTVTIADATFPLALGLISRLLFFGHTEEALIVLKAMHSIAITDDLILNWLTPMLSVCYNFLTPPIKAEFISIIQELPDSSKYFIIGKDMVFESTQLLAENDMTINQDPEVITRPYKSVNRYIIIFMIPAFILATQNRKELIDSLLLPVFDITYPWIQRGRQCYFISMLVPLMPADIGYEFYLVLLSKPRCEIALETARFFLINADLGLFRKICDMSYELIELSDDRLGFYMNTVLPSYLRITDDEATASKMLCGILQSVRLTTKRHLQESVIDVVGIVYMNLKLQKSRAKLVNASAQFPPELRTIIASSLDID